MIRIQYDPIFSRIYCEAIIGVRVAVVEVNYENQESPAENQDLVPVICKDQVGPGMRESVFRFYQPDHFCIEPVQEEITKTVPEVTAH